MVFENKGSRTIWFFATTKNVFVCFYLCRDDGMRIVFVWNFWSLRNIQHNLMWAHPLSALYIVRIECECTCVIGTKCLTYSEILLLLFCFSSFHALDLFWTSAKEYINTKVRNFWHQKTEPLQDCIRYSSMGSHGSAAFKIQHFRKILTSVWCL